MMFQRDKRKQPELNIVVLEPSDDEQMKKIKELIKSMVAFVPHMRAKAEDVKTTLQRLSAPEV